MPPEPERIVIGVTGHRVLMELEKINAGIDAALEHIKEKFPNRPLTILSALAEGADRMVAHRVLAQPDAHLIAILPLPIADYLEDFDESSQQEFRNLLARAEHVIALPPMPAREDAYEAGGLYTLKHCDILLTIWDGQGAQGVAGTGEIVAKARQEKKPLAWIHAGNRKPGTMEGTTLGVEQGRVTYETMN